MIGIIDKVNNFIINKILLYLEVAEKGEESAQKITYSLKVLIGEIEKFTILFIIFSVLGVMKEFLVVMITIGSIRGFLGGSHMKTTEGCIVLSFAMVFTILALTRHSYISIVLEEIIYIVLGVLIIKKAPVPSRKSINYTYKKRLEFKLRAMTILMIISRVVQLVSKEWANIILSALMIQAVEVGIVCILNLRKEGKKVEEVS